MAAYNHPSLNAVRKDLEAVMACGYHSYTVFEDWIALMFYAFQRDDEHYMETMRRYRNEGAEGQRPADYFAQALAHLMHYMAETNEDGLGPLFEEYAASQHKGQFFTPLCVGRIMARLTQDSIPDTGYFIVNDPACGAGIGFLAAAKEQSFEQNGRCLFVGQDVDINCIRMTCLNLLFFNLNGLVCWGNTLTLEQQGLWRTTRNLLWGGSLRPATQADIDFFFPSREQSEQPEQQVQPEPQHKPDLLPSHAPKKGEAVQLSLL